MKNVVTLALVLVLSVLALGWAVSTANAQAQSTHYRVIDENNGGKIERELNEITRQDPTCEPVLAIAPSDYNNAKVILKCGGS